MEDNCNKWGKGEKEKNEYKQINLKIMRKKTNNLIFPLLVMGVFLTFASSCKKGDVPVLTTNAATNIGYNSAISGGVISSQGADTITLKGVCWSTSQNPTAEGNITMDGTGTASYTSHITGLAANTTYYVRAFAMNSKGIGYGNQISFTTTTYNTGNNSLSATVDGSAYVATFISVQTNSGNIGISGMSGSKNILLWIPETFTIGSHTLSTYGTYMAQYTPGSSTLYSSSSGTINITSYNSATGEIKGTFNFVGTYNSATVNITNGQFDVFK